MPRLALSTLLLSCLLISSFATPVSAEEPKKLLLIGQGPDGHPPETHEFMAGLRVLAKCLEPVEGLTVEIVDGSEPWEQGPELINQADGVVLFLSQGARWMQTDPRRYDALAKLTQRGGGVSALHWAIGAHDAKYIEGQLKILGGTRGGPQRKYQVLETDVSLVDPQHPIVRGIAPFRVKDEFYYRLDLEKTITPILTAHVDDNDEVAAWAWQQESGARSFGFVGLHFHKNWEREDYRRLATQGVLWTLKLEIPEDGVPVEVSPDDLKLK